jgi:hypothetical protein
MTRLPLKDIGEFYDIGISGVTDICRKLRQELRSNETLAGNIAELENKIHAARWQSA